MSEYKKIPSREEISMEDKWAIEDLYLSDDAWEEACCALASDIEKMAAYEGTLEQSGQNLYDFLYVMEQTDDSTSVSYADIYFE